MPTLPLPVSPLTSSRTVTLYDADGNPVEVTLGEDGNYRLAVSAPGVEDRLARIENLLEQLVLLTQLNGD